MALVHPLRLAEVGREAGPEEVIAPQFRDVDRNPG
jgi:hypothetical protein